MFLIMPLWTIFDAKIGIFKVDFFIIGTTFGIIIIWFSSVLTYWMLFRKGVESCLNAGIFKSPLYKNKKPPIMMLYIVTVMQWLCLMIMGLLLILGSNAEWIAGLLY